MEFLSKSSAVFEKGNNRDTTDNEQLIQALYAKIGESKVANFRLY